VDGLTLPRRKLIDILIGSQVEGEGKSVLHRNRDKTRLPRVLQSIILKLNDLTRDVEVNKKAIED
jgi:hypothetical protein